MDDRRAAVPAHYESAEMAARYRSDGELSSAERALVEAHVPPGSSILDVGTDGWRSRSSSQGSATGRRAWTSARRW